MNAERKAKVTREDMLKMHQHDNAVMSEALGSCFKNFNFYIGLLFAVMVATVTGFLRFSSVGHRGLVILIGPVFVVVLARVGYRTMRVLLRFWSMEGHCERFVRKLASWRD